MDYLSCPHAFSSAILGMKLHESEDLSSVSEHLKTVLAMDTVPVFLFLYPHLHQLQLRSCENEVLMCQYDNLALSFQ